MVLEIGPERRFLCPPLPDTVPGLGIGGRNCIRPPIPRQETFLFWKIELEDNKYRTEAVLGLAAKNYRKEATQGAGNWPLDTLRGNWFSGNAIVSSWHPWVPSSYSV